MQEIKQEDVVDLGEEDEGDWGVEGDGGGGDSSMGSENHPNFPEVMLPHTDGSMPPSGDPAMVSVPLKVFKPFYGAIRKQQIQFLSCMVICIVLKSMFKIMSLKVNIKLLLDSDVSNNL